MALVAWYKLDGDTKDSIGNNHGIPTSLTYTTGKIEQAGSFNGTSSYISIQNINMTSVSLWANFNAATSNALYFLGSLSASRGIRYDGTSFLVFDGENGFTTVNWTKVNRLVHFVAVIRGTEYDIYIDGVKIGVGNKVTPLPYLQIDTIGTRQSFYFNGPLDDIRIYNHALSQKEIKELSKAKILHYDFNDFQEPTTNVASGTLSYYTPYNVLISRVNQDLQLSMVAGGAQYLTIHNGVNYQGKTIAISGSLYKNGVPWTLPGDRSNTYHTVPATTWSFNIDGKGLFKIVEVCDASSIWIFHTPAGTVGGDIITINNFQVEVKDHITPFTYNSRTGVVRDISGYGNDSTLVLENTPQWTSTSKIGSGCYLFNGVDNYINIGDKARLNNGGTISCWYYAKSIGENTFGRIIDKSTDTGSTNGYVINCYGNNTIGLYINGSMVLQSSTFTFNAWHHLVAVIASDKKEIWIDGVKVANNTNTSLPPNVAGNVYIGNRADNTDRTFDGYIDDMRIYNNILSATDIQELYQNRAQLDNTGNLFIDETNELGIVQGNNQIWYKNYVLGTYTSSGYQYWSSDNDPSNVYSYARLPAVADATYLNYAITNALNPNRTLDRVLKVYSIASLTYAGAYRVNFYHYFIPDITKTYRISQWVYMHKASSVATNRLYFGASTATRICNVNTTTSNTNPYFTTANINSPYFDDKWALMVYYIYPYGSTGNSTNNQGYYTPQGVFTNTGANFNWDSSSGQTYIRNYIMYQLENSLQGEYMMIYRPRIDMVDGSEPTIQELLTCGEHTTLVDSIGTVVSLEEGLTSKAVFVKQQFNEADISKRLIGWWPLNGNTKDYSENKNDAILNGTSVAAGLSELCYSFNGTSDYMYVPYTPILRPTLVSISVWAYATGWGSLTNDVILSKTEGGGYGLRVNETVGKYHFGIFANSTYQNVMVDSSTLTDGWHHFVGTFDGRYAKLYTDGILVGTTDAGGVYPITYGYSNALIIGAEANGATGLPPVSFFTGKIQDVRIYDRALSADEVKILYDLSIINIPMKQSKTNLYISNEFKELL